MKCIFEVNSRPILSESAESKHDNLIKLLKEIGLPWGLHPDIDVPFPGFKGEFTATSTLTKFLGNGIKMSVFYRFRNNLQDEQTNDDRIYIEFNSKRVDYEHLLTKVFPEVIKGFNAYTADIFDQQLIFKDHEEKRFANRRKVINRVYPVSYYDTELCKVFFKRYPKELVKSLQEHHYKAEVFNDGLLIIAGTMPYSMETSIEFENQIKKILKY
jgi:hypothetical protein